MERLDNFKDKIDDEELAKLERELEDRILGKTAPVASKIEALRAARTSNEYNLEGEEYAKRAIESVDKTNANSSNYLDALVHEQSHYTPPRLNLLSEVEGVSKEQLAELKSEAHNAFAPRIAKAPALQVFEIDLDRTVPLEPRKVGALALHEDIEKSSIDPDRGVRDFYNKVYSDHGEKRLREKEHYLNMAPTGDVSKARAGLKKYDSFNSLNAAAHDTINDGLISAMRDLHKEEREKNPKDEELAKRHLAEEKLFEYRETSEKLVGNNPQDAQREKDSFGAVMKAHTGYVEERWGRKLDPQKTPSVNDELAKMRNTAEPVVRPVGPTMAPKNGLKLKIGLHR